MGPPFLGFQIHFYPNSLSFSLIWGWFCCVEMLTCRCWKVCWTGDLATSVMLSRDRAQAVLIGTTCWWTSASWLISPCDIVILETIRGQHCLKICVSEVVFVISQVARALIHMHDRILNYLYQSVLFLGNTNWFSHRCRPGALPLLHFK